MNIHELAERLNGCQYGAEVSNQIDIEAKDSNLVIVFGASDDLMEFRGAIRDELGAYNGTTALVDDKGLLPDRETIDDDKILEDFFNRKKTAKKIQALWCEEEPYSWTFKTDIPHANFEVLEDGEKYCRGVVFKLSDAA